MLNVVALKRRLTSAIVLAGLGHLALELTHNFLPVIYPLLIERMGLTYTQIGTIAFVITLFGSITQPIFGYWSDRWDARWITAGSIVWLGVLMGLVGFIGEYWLLLLIVACAALGSAAFHPAGALLAASAKRRQGLSMSIFSMGGNLGSALSPLLVGTAVFLWGLSGTAVLIPLALLSGLLLYFPLRSIPWKKEEVATKTAVSSPTSSPSSSWLPLILIILLTSSRSWFQGGLNTYLPEWLQGQGVSLQLASSAFSIMLASLSIGSFTGGVFSDRFGHIPIVIASLGLLPVAHWLFLITGGVGQMAAVGTTGFLIGLTYPITILMAQAAWPQRKGTAGALVMGIGWMPAGIGAWLVGRIADQTTLTMGLQSLYVVPLVGLTAVLLLTFLTRKETVL